MDIIKTDSDFQFENVNNDSFFQPKNIKVRNEKLKAQYNEILYKVELGLKKIKREYECGNCKEEAEKMFLYLVSGLRCERDFRHPLKYIDLKDDDMLKGFFNLESNQFYIDMNIGILSRKMHDGPTTICFRGIFMNEMIKKYFDLDNFYFARH